MKSARFRFLIFAALVAGVSFGGRQVAHSNASPSQSHGTPAERSRLLRQTRPLSYRSPGARHKVMVRANDARLYSLGAQTRAKRYLDYTLVELSDSDLARLDALQLERAELRDDLNLIMLKCGQLDTMGREPPIDDQLRQRPGLAHSLHLVQLFGPPTTGSIKTLQSTGARLISYVPNNTYLVWATPSEVARVRALMLKKGAVQWEGAYHPAYKIDTRIRLDSVEQIPLSIVLVDSDTSHRAVAEVKSVARRVLVPEFRSGGMLHMRVLAESNRVADIARLPEVIAAEPWAKFRLLDERANQIVAGSLEFSGTSSTQVAKPSSPGYLNFLQSVGIDSDFDFVVDLGDTGLDIGSADPALVHPDFLDVAGASRIAYLTDFTNDSHLDDPTFLPAHDPSGHGTLNASIIAGFNDGSGSAFTDSLGFRYGLGVAPFVRIGASKVFTDGGGFSNLIFNDMMQRAYRNQARISSNSWGACDAQGFCNLYSDDSAVMDSLVRDADALAAGNQGMTIVFAAGNSGDILTQSVSIPATAKNVIAVGASENFRPESGDGCGVGTAAADNAIDIVDFSSGGPLSDGRAKPDLVAPGTHVQGAASQDKLFATASSRQLGVCNRFFPSGQTLYTWSSGTSHSTPMVSGAAALAFHCLRTSSGTDPSPALVKAFILNSASYLTGALGGGDLPGARQGWGLLDVGRMLEPTSRIVYDQAPERTFTESGGAPFEVTGVVSDPSKELRVMLVWTDPPGNTATNATLVNQLNLEVTVGGITYVGNVFKGQYSKTGGQPDFLNNVQGVRLPSGTAGPFLIRVRPTLIAGDGVPGNDAPLDQDFALVVTNAIESAVPVLSIDTSGDLAQGVTVEHSDGHSDSFLIPGETARITVTVSNHSQTSAATIQSAGLSITVGEQANGQSGVAFADIPPGGASTNATPFELQIPTDLRCGSTAALSLNLETALGGVVLNVPVQAGRPEADSPAQLVFDDVDDQGVKWKKKKGFVVSSQHAHSGILCYHVEDPGKTQNDIRQAKLQLKKAISIPENAGQVRLSFFHIFNFEPGFDGGVLEISSDGGTTWDDVGPRIITGGYDGKVTSASDNPLGSRLAWTARGRPGVYSQVVINLDDYAGEKIKLRFTAGFDAASGILDGYTGWFIDDIRITAGLFSCR